MAKTLMTLISGQILDERPSLSLGELSRVSALSAEKLIELVELGVIEPYGPEPDSWRFSSVCIKRVRRAHRLQRDLGVNAARGSPGSRFAG